MTGDARAKAVLDKWVGWVVQAHQARRDGGYEIPSTLEWTGKPARELERRRRTAPTARTGTRACT